MGFWVVFGEDEAEASAGFRLFEAMCFTPDLGRHLQWVSPKSVRLFHFICEKHGLDDIRKHRLKISQIHDLNDPFELLSVDLSNGQLRRVFDATKEQLANTRGMLCFSKNWSNPILWSHYADKHRGLCLGFEVANNVVLPVSYVGRRLVAEADQILTTRHSDERAMERLLSTKFVDWKYEDEVRCFVSLTDQDAVSGFYFADFSDSLKLVQVIVGARSDLSRGELANALDDLAGHVSVFKARLAFRTFRVVRNKNESLWT